MTKRYKLDRFKITRWGWKKGHAIGHFIPLKMRLAKNNFITVIFGKLFAIPLSVLGFIVDFFRAEWRFQVKSDLTNIKQQTVNLKKFEIWRLKRKIRKSNDETFKTAAAVKLDALKEELIKLEKILDDAYMFDYKGK